MWNLYLAMLLTGETHFHSQCDCATYCCKHSDPGLFRNLFNRVWQNDNNSVNLPKITVVEIEIELLCYKCSVRTNVSTYNHQTDGQLKICDLSTIESKMNSNLYEFLGGNGT